MTSEFPRVCISILTWNDPNSTIRCLESILQLDYPNFEVIVVDNASKDDSVERIRSAFPDIEIIASDTNRGYAGGNELALQRALTDRAITLFWILNNDTVVPPNALMALVEAYNHHGPALYGGVSVSSDSQNDRWLLKMTLMQKSGRLLRANNLRGIHYEDYFSTTEPRFVPCLHGGSLMIPLSVVRDNGFMDTDFFLYAEENDYCLRLGQRGIRSILVPESIIFHEVSASSKRQGLENLRWYYQVRNRLNLMRIHRHWLSFGLYLLHFCYQVAKYCVLGVAGRSGAWAHIRYTLLGIRDGLRGRMGKTYAPEDWI